MTTTAIQNRINAEVIKMTKKFNKIYRFDISLSIDMDGMIIVNFDGKNENKNACVKRFFSGCKFLEEDYDDYCNITMMSFTFFKGKAA